MGRRVMCTAVLCVAALLVLRVGAVVEPPPPAHSPPPAHNLPPAHSPPLSARADPAGAVAEPPPPQHMAPPMYGHDIPVHAAPGKTLVEPGMLKFPDVDNFSRFLFWPAVCETLFAFSSAIITPTMGSPNIGL